MFISGGQAWSYSMMLVLTIALLSASEAVNPIVNRFYDLVQAINKSVSYSVANYQYMNFDGVFGLWVAEGDTTIGIISPHTSTFPTFDFLTFTITFPFHSIVFVCSHMGFVRFNQLPLLDMILSWQHPSGCFTDDKKSPNASNMRISGRRLSEEKRLPGKFISL
ncbi:hypothetical protein FGIG_12395 [Fasciola gigantica]|uniref:Uncharacterized protein n=1 Tax=Fasciola gigantica TaxID=46835 RepID=A0A504YEV3_FASGI|nr:hypothetical protein FGIG_12395 [Fasciola gigantica]